MVATILRTSSLFGMGLLTLLAAYSMICSVEMAMHRGPVMTVWIEVFGVKITPERMFLAGFVGIVAGIAWFVYLW